jgi:hypothetical protein
MLDLSGMKYQRLLLQYQRLRCKAKTPACLTLTHTFTRSPANLQVHCVAADDGKGGAVARPRILQSIMGEGRLDALAAQRVTHPVAELLRRIRECIACDY